MASYSINVKVDMITYYYLSNKNFRPALYTTKFGKNILIFSIISQNLSSYLKEHLFSIHWRKNIQSELLK